MSRFNDYGDDDGEGVPPEFWEHNARLALKGRRGRKALAELREALFALPEHRLIDRALCTVGGADERVPTATMEEAGQYAADLVEAGADEVSAQRCGEAMLSSRNLHRQELAEAIEANGGEGVCGLGAYLWYQRVKGGMDPQDAFASLPTVFDADPDGLDGLHETAELGKGAGLTFTLAWQLAYRNDETYGAMTPEGRWSAFVAWIDGELAEDQAAKAGATA
jgi:hypothetical protein